MYFSEYNNIQREILLSFKYDYVLKYKEFPGEKEYNLITDYIHQRGRHAR